MQYGFSSTNQEKFSLHDCFATSAELKENRLIFKLPDGFYCEDYSNDWPNTGKAEVEFTIDPMRGVYLDLFVDSDGQTIRRTYESELWIRTKEDVIFRWDPEGDIC